MAKIAFDVFMKVVGNSFLEIQALILCHLDQYNISNLQSIVVVLYCEEKMTFLSWSSISSKTKVILAHNFCMKDIYISLVFP